METQADHKNHSPIILEAKIIFLGVLEKFQTQANKYCYPIPWSLYLFYNLILIIILLSKICPFSDKELKLRQVI